MRHYRLGPYTVRVRCREGLLSRASNWLVRCEAPSASDPDACIVVEERSAPSGLPPKAIRTYYNKVLPYTRYLHRDTVYRLTRNTLLGADGGSCALRLVCRSDEDPQLPELLRQGVRWLAHSLALRDGLAFVPGHWVALGKSSYLVIGRQPYGRARFLDRWKALGGRVLSPDPFMDSRSRVSALFPGSVARSSLRGIVRLYVWNDPSSRCSPSGPEGALEEMRAGAEWDPHLTTPQTLDRLMASYALACRRTGCWSFYQGTDEASLDAALGRLAR